METWVSRPRLLSRGLSMAATGWNGQESVLAAALATSIQQAITAAGGGSDPAVDSLAQGIANGLIPFLVANSLVSGVVTTGPGAGGVVTGANQ